MYVPVHSQFKRKYKSRIVTGRRRSTRLPLRRRRRRRRYQTASRLMSWDSKKMQLRWMIVRIASGSALARHAALRERHVIMITNHY